MEPLDVPMIFQEDDFSCTPVCMKMVLEFFRRRHPTIPELDIPSIARATKTDESGTMFVNIDGVNSILIKSIPSVEFLPDWGHQLKDIEEELSSQHPVIAWVMMESPQGPYEHSIVVTGLDKGNLLIYYNDPVYGRREMSLGEFTSIWASCFSILIRIEIGGKRQRLMEEYLKEGQTSEG